ncbi:MAG: hypothetical protein FWH02_02525 [Oscillospiraceae bacterium]|nr:hypothetical protein [Oscillospiraceae bacterium]
MKQKLKVTRLLISVLAAVFAVLLLLDAPTVAQGVSHGLRICAGALVPALFPFMVLSGFIASTGCGRVLSLPFGFVTEKLFKLPGELSAVVLLSMVGGYPVGARMISSLLKQKKISEDTAGRMLCFCFGAGPPFLITAVGAGMFFDVKAGLILFGTQLFASIAVGAIISARCEKPRSEVKTEGGGYAGAFVSAVTGASSAMLSLCAFTTLFSGILALLAKKGAAVIFTAIPGVSTEISRVLLAGIMEITSGCIAAANVGGAVGFGLASIFLSLGGISVLLQVVSFFADTPVRLGRFFFSRVLHSVIAVSFAVPLYTRFCGGYLVWAPASPPAMVSDSRTLLMSVCLLGMCVILSLTERRRI